MIVRDPVVTVAEIDARLTMHTPVGILDGTLYRFTMIRIDELLDERLRCQPVAYAATVPRLGWMATQPRPGADW